MDPLFDVLSLLKPRSDMFGGFNAGGDWSIRFGQHEGIKCYAVTAGQGWLAVEGAPEAVRLTAGGLDHHQYGPERGFGDLRDPGQGRG